MKQLFDYLGDRAALIITPENRRYFTGFFSTEGYVMAYGGKLIFLIDGRYHEAAERAVKSAEVVLLTDAKAQIKELFEKSGCSEILLETLISVEEAENIASFVPAKPDKELNKCILDMRAVKSREETDKIIKAQRIAEEAFLHMLDFIKPGLTEREIGLELDYFMLKKGAEALSFETIAVSGPNTSLPHGVPGDRVVQNGDFITMDFGAVYDGYHSDMTRTVALGYATDEMKEIYNTVYEAAQKAIDATKAGEKAAFVDKQARDHIEKAGYGKYFNHGTGHGVGLEIHEAPTVSFRAGETLLEEGHIITIEPGIYIPGKFGVRIEDMLLVAKDGYENLTKAEKQLIVVKPI
ncbi:MAG: aminopeptidase P family protein [Clostridia bacterium]|nr:aminopeptidase P family protein [Clostridia bacterium]